MKTYKNRQERIKRAKRMKMHRNGLKCKNVKNGRKRLKTNATV